MRKATFELKDLLRRFATVLTTLVVGLAFVLVGSAFAVPEVKEVEMKEPKEKIEKVEEKEDSRGLFNRNLFFDRNEGIRGLNLNEGNRLFNRAFFNPFFFVDPFDIIEDAIEEEFEERFERRDDRRGN